MSIRKISRTYVGFDHWRHHPTMIFTVNSTTTLMDDVESVYVRFFTARMRARARARTKLACIWQEAEAEVRSRGFKLTGLNSIVITPVWVLTRASTRAYTWDTRESRASVRVRISSRSNDRKQLFPYKCQSASTDTRMTEIFSRPCTAVSSVTDFLFNFLFRDSLHRAYRDFDDMPRPSYSGSSKLGACRRSAFHFARRKRYLGYEKPKSKQDRCFSFQLNPTASRTCNLLDWFHPALIRHRGVFRSRDFVNALRDDNCFLRDFSAAN